jgi:tRNA threonylcarbamoyladenosine biosynthesis protein TsaE
MQIGHRLHGGEVIELVGDLGAGKTAFVRGLTEGAGSHDAVRSPSFTLSNHYRANKFTIRHFDFYRLDEPGLIEQELAEALEDPQAVVIIEWGGIAKAVLPPDRLVVRITPTGETSRSLNFSCPNKLAYLLPERS